MGARNRQLTVVQHGRWLDTERAPELSSERRVDAILTLSSNRQRRSRLQGWRFAVVCSALAASEVLMLNLILTIYLNASRPTSFALIPGTMTFWSGNHDDALHGRSHHCGCPFGFRHHPLIRSPVASPLSPWASVPLIQGLSLM